ncbi:MAG: hypothetical protein HYW86_02500 [Candidatus Roizmanbacteria bacterium]|nr:MAG: hypothetical protein HYW86_02500 [Candidatus Roizmanbacteria bacterium]
MKKITIITIITVITFITVIQMTEVTAQTPLSGAQTKTATLSSTLSEVKGASTEASIVEKEIQNLKEKIATKVAELRKKNLKAIAGSVTEKTKNSFKITASSEDDYQVNTDSDLTKFYLISGSQKKEIKSTDLEKKSYIIVSGPVADKTINANVIYQDEQYLVKAGKVTEVNTDDELIKVLTTDKDNFTLDLVTSTKIQLMDSKTQEVETAKLSKVKEGDTIHFVVKKTGEEKELNRFSAEKILIIPQEYFIK